jgi:hypothetical protein
MQHPLISRAMATEKQHDLRAEGRAAGWREGARSGWLRGLLDRRRAARRRAGGPCLEPHPAS